MNQDFSELIEYLDKKFVNIDRQFINIDKQLVDLKENKSDKSDVSELRTALDVHAKKADTSFGEMVVLSHEVDRHERWFQQIAKKIDIKLEY